MSSKSTLFAAPLRRQRIALVALLVLPVTAVGLAACAGLAIMVHAAIGRPDDLDATGYVSLVAPTLAFGFVALAALFLYLRFEQGWRLRAMAGALAIDVLVLLGGLALWR